MSNKQALEYTRQNQTTLMRALEPLLTNFPVACFVYMELLNSNDYFFMSSDMNWGEAYLMRGSPGDTWVQGLKYAATQDQPTFMTWSLLESKDPIEQYCVDLGYRYGMNIYKREGDKIRVWAFDGMDTTCLHFFQTHKALLEQFIFYFEEQCTDLFANGRLKENLAQWRTPLDLGFKPSPSQKLSPSQINLPLFPKRHVSLHGPSGSVKLTQRQWEILKQSAQGFSMKEIARTFNISPRTVEDSLNLSKNKASVSTHNQLVKFVNLNAIMD